jgi:hypothetical protein
MGLKTSMAVATNAKDAIPASAITADAQPRASQQWLNPGPNCMTSSLGQPGGTLAGCSSHLAEADDQGWRQYRR